MTPEEKSAELQCALEGSRQVTVKVIFGFAALASLAIIGLCWDTDTVQAVLHFLRFQP